jgi:hypothetical protein
MTPFMISEFTTLFMALAMTAVAEISCNWEGERTSAAHNRNAHDANNGPTTNAINGPVVFLVSVFNQADILANSEGGRGSRSKWIKRAISSAVLLDLAMTHRFTAEGEKRGASIPAVWTGRDGWPTGPALESRLSAIRPSPERTPTGRQKPPVDQPMRMPRHAH